MFLSVVILCVAHKTHDNLSTRGNASSYAETRMRIADRLPAARAAFQYRDMRPFKISKQGFLV
jgi:hypothetical protein